jgi:hypothetical protein
MKQSNWNKLEHKIWIMERNDQYFSFWGVRGPTSEAKTYWDSHTQLWIRYYHFCFSVGEIWLQSVNLRWILELYTYYITVIFYFKHWKSYSKCRQNFDVINIATYYYVFFIYIFHSSCLLRFYVRRLVICCSVNNTWTKIFQHQTKTVLDSKFRAVFLVNASVKRIMRYGSARLHGRSVRS